MGFREVRAAEGGAGRQREGREKGEGRQKDGREEGRGSSAGCGQVDTGAVAVCTKAAGVLTRREWSEGYDGGVLRGTQLLRLYQERLIRSLPHLPCP